MAYFAPADGDMTALEALECMTVWSLVQETQRGSGRCEAGAMDQGGPRQAGVGGNLEGRLRSVFGWKPQSQRYSA